MAKTQLGPPLGYLDPIWFIGKCWPDIRMTPYQVEMTYSVVDNVETTVSAGTGLGKDWWLALICVWFMSSRRPARVVTTAVSHSQLKDVLWGEIRQFMQSSKIRLPLKYNDMYVRQIDDDGIYIPKCELVGVCVEKGESIIGKHLARDIPRTLLAIDEASGVSTKTKEMAGTWAQRIVSIGNPWNCQNYFRDDIEAGDLKAVTGDYYRRKVFSLGAMDSPNIQHAVWEILQGRRRPEPLLVLTDDRPWGIYTQNEYEELQRRWEDHPLSKLPERPFKTLIPGMIGLQEYIERRMSWSKQLQTVSLDGKFYSGDEIMLYPEEWIKSSITQAKALDRAKVKRKAKTMGIDTAEGGDRTVWTIIDEYGIIYQYGKKTRDTSYIKEKTIQLIKEYKLLPQNVLFDAGGGGKEHADYLRKEGYDVRTVSFGESVAQEPKHGSTGIRERRTTIEERYTYTNRRAQMYGLLSNRMNPFHDPQFAIPEQYEELLRQLSKIPETLDDKGRLRLFPKNKRNPESKEQTLRDLLGCSPDEADSAVLAVYGLEKPRGTGMIGPMFLVTEEL